MTMKRIQAPPSKARLCYESLRTAILRGDLRPGSRIVIDELTRQMGVSRIPIREALQRLQGEGLVELEPHVGVRVADIDADSVHEMFQLKEALEVISGRSACERMSEEDLARAEEILRIMDEVIDDPDRWSEENVRFHKFICDCAHMPLVGASMLRVLDHWERLRRYYQDEVFMQRHRVAHQEHWEILKALRMRDPDYLERVTHEHNRKSILAYAPGPGVSPRNAGTAMHGDSE